MPNEDKEESGLMQPEPGLTLLHITLTFLGLGLPQEHMAASRTFQTSYQR